MNNKITRIVTELQAISQIGLTFCNDNFDHERYSRIMEISAELASLHSSKSSCEILEIFSKDKGYITPKVGVRAAIFESNQILLVKERSDGLWSLPGGWADVNLSPKENMLREIREETGFECSIIKLICVCDKRKDPVLSKWPYIYDLFFLCSIIGGKVKKTTLETSNLKFFSEKNIPPLSVNRVNDLQIKKCFSHYSSPLLPTEFD
ncbi:MAG: NUDIX hydrolase [Candidatus Rhabdochlamydia sp.]